MTDTLILLAALAAFGGLLSAWMLLPISTETEEIAATDGRPATIPV
jgi:hypothetical protein